MPDASCFSPDYTAARARFRSSAMALGARLEAHGIGRTGPDGEELTLDVAIVGPTNPDRLVIVSSGLHGIEGFFGSAVQVALLEEVLVAQPMGATTGLVLLHALNPYGFAHRRRVNEDNIDLNRNFLLPGEEYAGAPEKYALLDGMLNPKSPPPPLEVFLLQAAFNIARHGMPALKDAVAGGQYEFPQGVFYGGAGPSKTQQLLAELLPRYVGNAKRILHIDFHTGLGRPGTYKLLVDHQAGSDGANWLSERFGDNVEPWAREGVSYSIRGGLGTWCKHHFPGREYDVLAAEFGTVPILHVIRALRTENRAHHWGTPEMPSTQRAKEQISDTFAPRDRRWRDEVVQRGVDIVTAARAALGG